MSRSQIIDIQKLELAETNSNLEQLLDLMKTFNIVEIEPLLSEDVSLMEYNKYDILAVFRDVFQVFKEAGDTQLSIREGGCGSTCELNGCPVYHLYGNKSRSTFAFVVRLDGEQIVCIHPCMEFRDMEGKPAIGWEKTWMRASMTLLNRKSPEAT